MDKASIIAIEEVCKRCPLYTEHCGMSEYPSQCANAGHFIDGYRNAEKDTIERIRKQVKQWMPEKDGEEYTFGKRLAFNSVLHLLEEMEEENG